MAVAVAALLALATTQTGRHSEAAGVESGQDAPRYALSEEEFAAAISSPEAVQQMTEAAEAETAAAVARQEWLDSPAAEAEREDSETAFNDLDSAAARAVLVEEHEDSLDSLDVDPARTINDEEIESLEGDNVVIDPGAVGGPPLLVDADLPLVAENEVGRERVVNLERHQTESGFATKNAAVPVSVSESLGGGIDVAGGVTIGLAQSDQSAQALPVGDSDVLYPNVQADTDLLVAPIAGGVEVFSQLRSPDSPTVQRLAFDLPPGASLVQTGEAVEARLGDQVVAYMPAPTAVDAQGAEVPVTMTAQGDAIVLEVPHSDADFAYPILVDPVVDTYNWYAGGSETPLLNGDWFKHYSRDAVRSKITLQATCRESCASVTGLYDRGAYVYGEATSYQATDSASWHTQPPGLDSYVTQASFQHKWFRPGTSTGQDPFMFAALLTPDGYTSIKPWRSPNPQAQTDTENTLVHGVDPNGGPYQTFGRAGASAVVFGLDTRDPVTSLSGVRWAYLGGASITMGDASAPTVTAAEITAKDEGATADGWIGKTDLLGTMSAKDDGLGLKTLSMTHTRPNETANTLSRTDPCKGGRTSPCPATWTIGPEDPFSVSSADLAEGVRSIDFQADDILGKKSPVVSREVKIDTSKPDVTLSGPLSPGADQPGLSLTVQATDGSRSDPKLKRSGVRSIDLLIDGKAMPGPAPQACADPGGSCEMRHTFNIDPAAISEGRHDFKVVVRDQLGQPRIIPYEKVVDFGGPRIERVESSHALNRPLEFEGSDPKPPDPTKITSRWIKGGDVETQVFGRDPGAGMESFELRLPAPDGRKLTESAHCAAEPFSECAEYTGATFQYSVGNFPAGVSEAVAIAYDERDNPSPVVRIPYKVDRQAPQRDEQLFQNSDLFSQRDALVYGRTYTLSLRGNDSAAVPSSGTREIEVLVDGQRRGYWRQPCPQDNCPVMRSDFVFDTTEYSKAEPHTIETRITDGAGNTTSRSFQARINEELGEVRPESRLFGLEQYFQYDSTETGLSGLHANLGTGNVVWHSTPLINPGRGLSSVLNLTYNSYDQRGAQPVPNGSLRSVSYSEAGIGWSAGLSGITRINEPLGFLDPTDYGTPATVALTDPDGTTHEFKLKALEGEEAGAVYEYDPPPGVNLRLRQYSNVVKDAQNNLLLPEKREQAWAITRPDGVTYFFDGWGYLRSIEDRNHNKMSFEYALYNPATNADDACLIQVVSPGICEPRLVRVVDAAGTQAGASAAQRAKRTISISYWSGTANAGQKNRIKDITDHEGRVLRLDYNGQGYLSSMTQAFGTSDARTRAFEYVTPSGGINRHPQLSRVSDFKGQYTRVDYYGDNGHRRAFRVTNRNNNFRSYAYGGNLTDPAVPTTATVTDAEGKQWGYSLDLKDRPLLLTDPLGTKTELRWDSDNNVIGLTEAAGSPDEAKTSMTYDANGLLTSQTDALGRTTELSYRSDAGVFRSAYTSNNQSIDSNDDAFVADLIGTRRPAGNTWAYELAPTSATNGAPTVNGNVLSQTDPFGYKATATYNPDGTLKTEADEAGDLTRYLSYDLSGLPQEVIDPRGKRWLYDYDEVGKLLQTIDPRGSGALVPGVPVEDTRQFTTTLRYDNLDRLRHERIPKDSANAALSIDARFIDRRYEYDPNDNLTKRTDGVLEDWTTGYTPMDRPTYDLTPLDEKTAYSYDKEERLVEVISPRRFTEDAAGRAYSTSYHLDAIGRRVAEIRQASASTKDLITSYAYDRRDNVVGVSPPKNNQSGGQTVSPEQAVLNASSPASRRFEMFYDEADQLVAQVEDPAGEALRTVYGYDQNGNRHVTVSPRALDEGADPAAFAWYTDFDARDMPVAEVSPLGDKTRMTYTKDGLLASETRPNGVDTAAAGDYTTTYTYNKAGQLETRSIPYREGQYQPDGKPLGSLKVTYTRDEVGDPTTITDARGFSFENRFLDNGQLKSTERPSWWDLDWSGGQPSPTPGENFRRQPGSSAGEPDTAVPVGGPTLVERTRPEDGGGTKDGMLQPLGAFNGATDFGDVDAQALPSMLSPAAIAQPMRLDYDDELRLTSTTPARLESEDPAPFTIGYDADGRVKSRSWPLDSAGADNITDATISHRFSYDANSNLTGFVNGVGSKAGEQPDQAGPNTTRWTYDAFDRRTEELAPGSLSGGGDSSIEREVTKFGYDANGNVLAVETPRGVATTGNSSDFTFTYRYDSLDRLASEANALGDTWTYAYDAASNVVAETSPRGTATSTAGDFTTTTEFDRADRPVLIEEPEARTTELEYDSNGNVVRATEPGAATELSEAMESDDLSAHVTTYAYDGRDLPWKETVGEGTYRRTTVTEYDPEGQLRRTVNPRGVDSNGNPLQADSQSDPWLAATHATVNTWSRNGLLVTSRMPRASEKPVGPSSAGPLNDPYQDEVAANAEKWRQDFRYDKRGRLKYVSAPHEQADAAEVEEQLPSTGGSQSVPGQTYKFFDTGWIARSDDSQVVDPQEPNRTLQGQAIAYSYDANGNQTRWQSHAVGSRDEFERFDDRQITRSFYPSGSLKSRTGEIELASSTPERSYKYFYNPNRSLVEIQDTLPQQLANDTGVAGDRTTKIFRDDAERELAVKEAWDTGRDTAFSYDRDGNLLTRKTDGSFTEGTGSYAGGKTTSFTYDDVGRELTMDVSGPGEDLSVDTDYYPSGVVAARTRQVGANDPVQEAYAYRTDSLVSRAMREGGEGNEKDQTYLYDLNGNRTQDERGGHFFNARDQLVFWHRDAEQPAQGDTSVSYALNGAGSIEDKWDEAMPTGEERTQYFYEGERLVRTEAPKLRSYYFYDLFGNVTQIDSDSKEGGVFPSTPQGPNPDELCSNRATGGDGSGITNYCYDEFERLVKTTAPGEENPVRYIHDGLDRRDLKLVGSGSGTAREYSYVGTSELLAREEDSDSKRRTYDYGSDGLRVAQLARDAQGDEEYHPFALDALGSVEALEEEDGSVEANSDYRYDPYGQIEVDPEDDSIEKPEDTLSEDAKANPFRFQGHYYDSGTQTYDMKAREYRPDVGRFLSADRFEQASKDLALQADPLTQNRYAFAGGNPVSRIDWDGHFPGYNDQQGQLGKSPPPKALDTTPPPKAAPAPDALWNRKEALITEIKSNPENPLNDGLVQGDPYEMSLDDLQDIYAAAEERCPGCREEPWQPSWGDLATAATFLPLPSSVAGKFCLKFCDDGGRLFGRVFGGGEEAGETVARSTVPAAREGGDVARSTVTALTREQDAALSAVMRDPNKLSHIFGQQSKHGLGPITRELGSQQAVVREAILRVPRTQPEGVFKIATQIGPHPTTVTGNMIGGVPRISNLWVPR